MSAGIPVFVAYAPVFAMCFWVHAVVVNEDVSAYAAWFEGQPGSGQPEV
ncbi:MAG: hypothetical protein JKY49_10370 [Cohaesibacteraceae bacterium]|nr:hypothetical protein [Cohaesibacteraceae bacterium]